MITKRIEINLRDDDAAFVQWYANRDGISFVQELKRMLYVAIEDELMIYRGDFIAETGIEI